MKKFVIMCCLFLGIAAASHAQGGGGRRFNPEERAKRMQTQLKLSDEQTTKLTAIYKEQGAKLDSLRTAGGGREQFRPLMEASNVKVKAVLTAEQAAQFEKMQTERRSRNGQGDGTPPPPPPAPQK